jgi:HemY protein
MRSVIWLLLLFSVAVLMARALGMNDGLVTIYWAPYQIQLALNFALILAALGVGLGFVMLRALTALWRLPRRAQVWRDARRLEAAQAALREAMAYFFAARYSRAFRAARRAVELHTVAAGVDAARGSEAEAIALNQLLAAHSLHRLQDARRRDAALDGVRAMVGTELLPGSVVIEGAALLSAEWALDDRDAVRALRELDVMPPGVGRRTQALRLRLQAARLAQQPLDALHTARLLSKHQAFAPIASQSLIRSLAIDALDTARDLEQIRKVWDCLDVAERKDARVVAHAAICAARFDADGRKTARDWLKPHWDRYAAQEEISRTELGQALLISMDDEVSADWLPVLERAIEALPADPELAYVVGRVMMARKLWGRARRLLEMSTSLPGADSRIRRGAWSLLGSLAERDNDSVRAEHCYREAAHLNK